VRPTLAADHAEDRNVARAALIDDCQIVYVQSIGGPATAKVVRAGVHPVKVAVARTRAAKPLQALAQLQQALRHPPPWLARIMGVEAGSLARFAADLVAEDA
jgi:nitrogen fixation protein NifX